MSRLVWAPTPLPELDHQTGFVSVDDEARAQSLIDGDQVQDPRVGALALRPIGAGGEDRAGRPAADRYATREMRAPAPGPASTRGRVKAPTAPSPVPPPPPAPPTPSPADDEDIE